MTKKYAAVYVDGDPDPRAVFADRHEAELAAGRVFRGKARVEDI